ncbi:solute carrier family 35 member G1-like [Lampetra planeri]
MVVFVFGWWPQEWDFVPRLTVTPGAVTVTPGAVTVTPGAVTVTPGAVAVTPGAVTVTPGAVTVTPGAVTVTPGAGHGTTFPGAGIILALVSSLAVTVNSLLVKKIDSVAPLEIAFIRFFFQAAFILPLLIHYRRGGRGGHEPDRFREIDLVYILNIWKPLLLLPPPSGKRLSTWLLLLLRGLLGAAGNICVVVAVRALPLSDATVITFSRAALTGGIARGVLGEPCSAWDAPLGALAFAGVTLAARPAVIFGSDDDGGDDCRGGDDEQNGPAATVRLLGSLAALFSALCSAGAFVCLRLLGDSASLLASTWAIALAGTAQSLLLLLLLPPPARPSLPCPLPCDPPWARAALVLTGPVAALGQLSLARALQLEGAGLVAAIRTCDVLLATVAQAAMLDEGLPGPLSVVGAACVALSAAGAALVKKRQGPREAERRSAGPEGSESDRERLLTAS